MYRINVIAFLILWLSLPGGAVAQDTVRTGNQAISERTNDPALPTVAELSVQREATLKNGELDEAARTLLDTYYAKAIENLQAATQSDQAINELSQELMVGPGEVNELQNRLGKPLPETVVEFPKVKVENLDALAAGLKSAEQKSITLRQELQNVTAELERRALRRPQLPELKQQVDQQLQEVVMQLAQPPVEGEIAPVTEARRAVLNTRQYRLRRERALLEQETRTYEGSTRYKTLLRDLAERDLREADRVVQAWQEKVAAARKMQAEDDAKQARIATAKSHSSVKLEAEKNAELADENAELVAARQETQMLVDGIAGDLKQREVAFDSLQERAVAADFSPAIGVLLRNQKSTLPSRQDLRLSIRARQSVIARLNLKLMEWEIEKKPIIDVASATTDIINELPAMPISISKADLEEQVQVILAARLKLLGDLIENGRAQLDQLVELQSFENQLLKSVDEEANWLAEHVLWVRSTGVLGTHPRRDLETIQSLFSQKIWKPVQSALSTEVAMHALYWVASLLIFIAALLIGRRLKTYIKEAGLKAARPNCTVFHPTLQALVLTLLKSAPAPFMMWCLGTRLVAISQGNQTLQSSGLALVTVSFAWGVIEFIRQVAQPFGIGTHHFDWTDASMGSVRRAMRFLIATFLPALLFASFSEFSEESEVISSLGRIAFLIMMVSATWSVILLFRPGSPILSTLESEHSDELLWRSRWIWLSLLYTTPVVLAGLSIVGFHYTAVKLAGMVATSIGCFLLAFFATSLLSRWLLVTYRKLAIRRGRERRQQLQQAAQADPDQPIPQDATPEIELKDINVQARRLLRLSATIFTLAALYIIWIDVLPALGILGNINMGWTNGVVSVAEGSIPPPVTAADVIVAGVIAVLTFISARNLPGLLEIVILQRLPLDAGARYAASTVCRYLILLTGFLWGFRSIGIGWSSVQWLIAAMTVGLGFGLQEIFANFVSGIILLFERPVRVGDTVTISDVTGTVTRIQIRATTILDWDNKELIVPNREFVTGHLVNWTLSNPMLRLTTVIGVAYGSDTRLATQLLYQVAKENPQVLDEPEPVVVFTEFGESCLNFELRLFVTGLATYRRIKHELHLQIDDLFREHKIEIAFPQRDLHIRTLPLELLSEKITRKEDSDLVEQIHKPTWDAHAKN